MSELQLYTVDCFSVAKQTRVGKRKQYTGRVCIYRKSCCFSGTLSMTIKGINRITLNRSGLIRLADIKMDGLVWKYDTAPQAFVNITYGDDPCDSTTFIASFTANADGSNPRSVKFIKEIV